KERNPLLAGMFRLHSASRVPRFTWAAGRGGRASLFCRVADRTKPELFLTRLCTGACFRICLRAESLIYYTPFRAYNAGAALGAQGPRPFPAIVSQNRRTLNEPTALLPAVLCAYIPALVLGSLEPAGRPRLISSLRQLAPPILFGL